MTPAAEDTKDEPLLDWESSLGGMLGEGVTTVTFYRGDLHAASACLKERLGQVAAANPWIFGCLVKEKQHGKRAALRFSAAPPVTDAVFTVNESLKLY
jgi:hypothetical protein